MRRRIHHRGHGNRRTTAAETKYFHFFSTQFLTGVGIFPRYVAGVAAMSDFLPKEVREELRNARKDA
ncbi:MAG: hypothetical protein KJO42_10610, partial [Silicimonas sp.]|nr:hypothetical protein [Silicimonas sp.]